MFRGNPAHTGAYETAGVRELGGVLWRFETMGPVRSSPTIAGGTVYVGSTDGSLYAVDAASGAERWHAAVGSPVSSSPAVAHGLVIFGSRDGAFHAVRSSTGELEWKFDTGDLLPWEWGFEGWDIYTSSPVLADSVVVFGAGDGSVYALQPTTGAELWRFDTDGRIRSTPAIADGIVFAGSTDGLVYALDLASGSEVWRHATEGAGMTSADLGVDRKSIIAPVAVSEGLVFIGSRDGYMYALDQQTGERRWRFSHDGSWAMSAPAISGGTLYAGTSDGRFVHALDVQSGEELWRFTGEGYTWASPAFADGTVYAGDGAGPLWALDAATGAERWHFPASGGVYSSPVVQDGVVFFGTEDGSVYALHGEGRYAHRAVFYDDSLRVFNYYGASVETRVHFEQRGYSVLDGEALTSFLEARIQDGAPSVVVFAMDHLPSSVAAEPADSVLFRRYLEAGGKVVWPGLPPMLLARDEAGRFVAIDRARSSSLTGVDYTAANFDFYASIPTESGRRWGLTGGWVSTLAVEPSEEIEVLAIDENGRAGAWVKSYGGPEGTGLVGFSLDKATPAVLEALWLAAEFGL
jgi:outer membrane protein assembly factor BamB